MLEAFSTPLNRRRTFILFAVCGVFAIAYAAASGDSEFPFGPILVFLSVTAFVLAFTHPWRASKRFEYLFSASGLGFIVFGVLRDVFRGITERSGGTGLRHGLLIQAGVSLLLIAVLGCISGLVVGAVGVLVMSSRERRSSPGAPAA